MDQLFLQIRSIWMYVTCLRQIMFFVYQNMLINFPENILF